MKQAPSARGNAAPWIRAISTGLFACALACIRGAQGNSDDNNFTNSSTNLLDQICATPVAIAKSRLSTEICNRQHLINKENGGQCVVHVRHDWIQAMNRAVANWDKQSCKLKVMPFGTLRDEIYKMQATGCQLQADDLRAISA